ncbi:MAG: hypothetical protein IAG13_06845 [Deltaproteobacteria bacterium]|nr:hypothetical protein [Nannocystaceae bacterium]
MDDEAEAMLLELGRRAREREGAQQTDAPILPVPDAARRREMLLAIGVEPRIVEGAVPAPRSRARIAVVTALGCVAAAVAVAVLLPSPPTSSAVATTATLSVIYDLELAGGRAEQLSAPARVPVRRYRASDPLVVRMRPRVSDPGPRLLSLRARADGADTVILAPALARADDGGMLELHAPLGELLPIVPGRWLLDVGVGLPGACEQDSSEGCTWARATIEIVDGP